MKGLERRAIFGVIFMVLIILLVLLFVVPPVLQGFGFQSGEQDFRECCVWWSVKNYRLDKVNDLSCDMEDLCKQKLGVIFDLSDTDWAICVDKCKLEAGT